MKPQHIASYQHVLLTNKSFPVPAFAYPGPEPYEEDADMKEHRLCADDTMDTRTIVPDRPPEIWEQRERDGKVSRLPSMCTGAWFSCQALLQYHQ